MKTRINSFMDQMNQVQDGGNWIGTCFKKKLRTVSEEDFFYKTNGLHSMAEIIAHLTVWRNETILKVKTGKGIMTDDDEDNWKGMATLKKIGKKELLSSYEMSLIELLEVLKSKSDDFLDDLYYDADFREFYPYSFVLNGMLHHDIYHLGQISLLITMIRIKS